MSIPSNIAEGQARLTRGEFKQFLGIARGSLSELGTQVELARQIGFLSDDRAGALSAEVDETGKILNGLLTSIRAEAPKTNNQQLTTDN